MFTATEFWLTPKQWSEAEEWEKSHPCSCRNAEHKSCVGGETSVIFTPTSMGTFVKIKCICGGKHNLGFEVKR